jgi:hypothetical protein
MKHKYTAWAMSPDYLLLSTWSRSYAVTTVLSKRVAITSFPTYFILWPTASSPRLTCSHFSLFTLSGLYCSQLNSHPEISIIKILLGHHMALLCGGLSLRAHSTACRSPKVVGTIMGKQRKIFLNQCEFSKFYSWQLNMPITVTARIKT